jgi:hypothetical protein
VAGSGAVRKRNSTSFPSHTARAAGGDPWRSVAVPSRGSTRREVVQGQQRTTRHDALWSPSWHHAEAAYSGALKPPSAQAAGSFDSTAARLPRTGWSASRSGRQPRRSHRNGPGVSRRGALPSFPSPVPRPAG